MTQHPLQLLDNPVWHALQTTHQHFALGTPACKRYPATVLPFMGYDPAAPQALNDMAPWMQPDEKVFIVGDLPPMPASWEVTNQLACLQMVCEHPISRPVKHPADMVLLSEADRPEMYALINLVQPGYFKTDTPSLGDYYGIRQDGKLVAMAGQRLRLTGCGEISAVCTHPDYTGKGLAQQLLQHLCYQLSAQGILPFLHVLASNTRAVGLYEWLGFVTRRDIFFTHVQYHASTGG
ncbi:GNAT family N-acetyltransferase [Chitinophaga nivalis]|uniref:GNAT family N-acetyltransferase n=1 Tax=Chitinophaga nivalis TaxID=2991709 RepID=A0ABT3IP72_9BACT|nr:GNAT family N-acetyltransferase [Chitinophaga nivalis]MCW3464534.1 GNAT family N-acetyltransferase [Chitinophaga nivalis]MCW3485775.1 GNAT family N-acetyltransferase [Chitinophaga nivalis]